jgi:hypothetical protein
MALVIAPGELARLVGCIDSHQRERTEEARRKGIIRVAARAEVDGDEVPLECRLQAGVGLLFKSVHTFT